jgi:probable addiction module antidote protein
MRTPCNVLARLRRWGGWTLTKDAGNAAAYVDDAIEEGDEAGLMQALRNVAEARGGITNVAEKTGLNRETLYRTLSKRGNPQLKSLASILAATGLRLTVTEARGAVRKAALL